MRPPCCTICQSVIDAAAIGDEAAGDQVQCRRLARAVRADKAETLAGLYGKADPIHSYEAAEGFGQPIHIEQGLTV